MEFENVNIGSEVGRGDADLTLWSRSLGVSLLPVGSVRKADGFGDEADWDRVNQVDGAPVEAVAVEVVASVVAIEIGTVGRLAASSACSSSPQGHM